MVQTFRPDRDSRKERSPTPDWAGLVSRIFNDDTLAMEELYAVFGKGIRYLLLRNLGPNDLDDRVHDCFVIVVQAIKKGEIRDPDRLMGFIQTVVKRQIAGAIHSNIARRNNQVDFEDTLFRLSDHRDDPERAMLANQRAETVRRVLNGIGGRDREILQRFYVLEQSQEQICEEMCLSYNQFRLLKSRAKARFGQLGKRHASRAVFVNSAKAA